VLQDRNALSCLSTHQGGGSYADVFPGLLWTPGDKWTAGHRHHHHHHYTEHPFSMLCAGRMHTYTWTCVPAAATSRWLDWDVLLIMACLFWTTTAALVEGEDVDGRTHTDVESNRLELSPGVRQSVSVGTSYTDSDPVSLHLFHTGVAGGENPWASLSATFPLHLRHSNSTLLFFYKQNIDLNQIT